MARRCNLDDELNKLFAAHTNFSIGERTDECSCVVRGTLSPASIKSSNIKFSFDEFEIKIIIKNFPKNIPLCYEISSLNSDFHINPDKSLCLDTPFTLWKHFAYDTSLLNFVNTFLVPYFIQYKHYKKCKEFIFGERNHGGRGVIEQYAELLKTNNLSTLALLTYGIEYIYRGHHLCPCGSNLRLRKCHGAQIRNIFSKYPLEYHIKDILYCVNAMQTEHKIKSECINNFFKYSTKKQITCLKKIQSQLMKRLKLGYC